MNAECGEKVASCICGEPVGHMSPHVCYEERCGGSWTGQSGTSTFRIVVMPGFGPEGLFRKT